MQVKCPATGHTESQELAEGGRYSVQEAIKRLEPYRRASVQKKAKILPVKARPGYLRAAAEIASPREAIKAFCMECTGGQRHEVTLCTALACPLFSYRPFQLSEIKDLNHGG